MAKQKKTKVAKNPGVLQELLQGDAMKDTGAKAPVIPTPEDIAREINLLTLEAEVFLARSQALVERAQRLRLELMLLEQQAGNKASKDN